MTSQMPSRCTRPKRRWPWRRGCQRVPARPRLPAEHGKTKDSVGTVGLAQAMHPARRPDRRTAWRPTCYHLLPVLFPATVLSRARHGIPPFGHATIVAWATRWGSTGGHTSTARTPGCQPRQTRWLEPIASLGGRRIRCVRVQSPSRNFGQDLGPRTQMRSLSDSPTI